MLSDRQLRPDRTLVVFDSQLTDRVRLSGGMNVEKLEAYGIDAQPYDGIEDAGRIIRAWLPELAGRYFVAAGVRVDPYEPGLEAAATVFASRVAANRSRRFGTAPRYRAAAFSYVFGTGVATVK